MQLQVRLLWLALLAALAGSPTRAQDRSAPVFRSETSLVTLTATITDKEGHIVTGLRKEDFDVFEEGVRQEIAFFAAGEQVPVSIGLVVDTSGSMIDKLEDVEDAIGHFLDALKPEDEVFMLQFSDRVDVLVEFADSRERARRAVQRLRARGGTALYDALAEGVQLLGDGKHRKRALLLLTDGNDTASQLSLREAADLAAKSEVLIYALGIGHSSRGSWGHVDLGHRDTVDVRTLRRFAEPSGGRSYLLEDAHRGGVDLVDRAVAEMGAELRQQYTVGYYPSGTDRSAKSTFRLIRVRLSNPSYRVRARAGYWTTPEAAGSPRQ